jgi:hypothetical protein
MLTYLGLLLILITWAAGGYLLTRWRSADLKTISKHAASTTTASQLFAIVLVGCGLIFYFWIIRWFVPHLHLQTDFIVTITATIFCQILTGLAPDTDGWRRKLHRTAAYTMAVLYLPLAVLILISSGISTPARVTGYIPAAYMLVAFVVVVVLKKFHKYYLQLQALYIIAFQILILLAAYVR